MTAREALGLGNDYLAPRTALERSLATIWAEILNLDQVGIGDDFFELGGDSVSGAVMVAEIDAKLGLKVPMSILLECSTVAAMAGEIDTRRQASDAARIYRLTEGGSLPPLFLIHGAAGIITLEHTIFQGLGRDLPVFGVQARGLLGIEPPHRSFEAMAAEYVPLIRSVQPRGPHFLAGICIGGTVALEMAHQLLAAGEPPRALLLVDPYATDDDVGGGLDDVAAMRQTHAGRQYLAKVEIRLRSVRGIDETETQEEARRNALLKAMMAVQEGINYAADRYILRPYPLFMSLFCNDRTARAVRQQNSVWRTAAQGKARLWNLAPTHQELLSGKLLDLGKAMRRDIDAALGSGSAPTQAQAGRDGT